MATPQRTPEQRAAALAKAVKMRQGRAALLNDFKAGKITLQQLLDKREEEVAGGIRVLALLECYPGIGPTRAKKLCEDLHISTSRRLQGLGYKQRAALLETLAKNPQAK